MTPQPITHGTEPGRANNPPGIAEAPHAYVENGRIFIMECGRYIEASCRDAFWLWFGIHDSPYASTQERARQIMAAMDEAYPERLVA